MANVHGFRDINANQNNRQRLNNGGYQNLNPNIGDNVPFLNNVPQDRPPLDETIPYTIKMICCPTIKPWHLSCILSLVMIGLYIICCTQGIDKTQNVLEIAPDVLIRFGAMQDILLKNGQVYRLLTASFLHMNLLHITMNLISFIFLLSRLQKIFNVLFIIGILVGSSISANIFSALCNKPGTISAGASGLIFGVLGAYLAYMTINWSALAAYGPMRSQICCLIGFIVFFSILFSFGPGIDFFGHLGGMIGGYLISMAILPGLSQKNKYFTIGGSAGYLVYTLVTFLVFFLTN